MALGAPSQNLAKLQATVNRFADARDFPPLVIDGGMGGKTLSAVIEALSDSVQSASSSNVNDARSWLTALQGASSDDVRETAIMGGLDQINTLLTSTADEFGYDRSASVAIAKPIAPSSGIPTPDRSAFKVAPPPGAGVWTGAKLWFRQLPQVGQVGVGVGAGLALLFAFTRFRKAKR